MEVFWPNAKLVGMGLPKEAGGRVEEDGVPKLKAALNAGTAGAAAAGVVAVVWPKTEAAPLAGVD